MIHTDGSKWCGIDGQHGVHWYEAEDGTFFCEGQDHEINNGIVTGGPNDASLTGEVRTTSSTGGQKGTKRARFDLIPTGPLKELAEHYGRGALKYDDNQWRKGYEWSKSYAAKQRHDNAFWAGYDYDVCSNDPEGCSFVTAEGEEYVPVEPDTCYNHTGSHHMAASAWHAFCLLEFKDRYPEHDDRYVSPEQREKNAHPLRWVEGEQ